MIYYVYELINSLDDKVFYVGKGKGRRMYIHENRANRVLLTKGENKKLRNKIHSIWNKNGSIKYNQIYFTNCSLDAYNKETDRIKEIGLKNLCNLIIYPFTPEAAYNKRSKEMMGTKHSEYTKNKIRNSLLGHIVSEETRNKIRLKKWANQILVVNKKELVYQIL